MGSKSVWEIVIRLAAGLEIILRITSLASLLNLMGKTSDSDQEEITGTGFILLLCTTKKQAIPLSHDFQGTEHQAKKGSGHGDVRKTHADPHACPSVWP